MTSAILFVKINQIKVITVEAIVRQKNNGFAG